MLLRILCIAFIAAFMCSGFSHAQSEVTVILSTQDGEKELSREAPLEWQPLRNVGDDAITVNPNQTYQSILGLGSSWEHATCENLFKLPEAERNEVIKRVVHPEEGIGMNLMRLCIGASDFIGEPYYTYNDLPPGETDPDLEKFSIEKDREYVIPVIKKSMEYNPDLLFFASPWSPPAWMKTTGELGGGRLKPEYYGAWALYLAKFIEAYTAEGIPIHAITVQNEPQMESPDYPTTLWTGDEQRDFIRDHLGPLFQERGINTLVWCWDHNWNKIEFPRAVLSDPEAAQYVDGTAWHLYEGTVDAQSKLHEEFPDKHTYFTEGSVFRTTGAARLAGILRHWSRTYNAWVTMLTQDRKPNRGPHLASATCIELNDDLSVSYRYDYFMYGQFMKFIQRGAVRVESNESDPRFFTNVAFRNPDGTIALVVVNVGREPRDVTIACLGRMVQTTQPANSVATYIWTP